LRDSRLRLRAMLKSMPSLRSAAALAGGSELMAGETCGISIV
jgi:hypothetical protein